MNKTNIRQTRGLLGLAELTLTVLLGRALWIRRTCQPVDTAHAFPTRVVHGFSNSSLDYVDPTCAECGQPFF
jgi:hypothetical protein